MTTPKVIVQKKSILHWVTARHLAKVVVILHE